MTPEERREIAERLDQAAALNERTAKVMGNLGRGWAKAAADLRAAAAALRKDADALEGPLEDIEHPVVLPAQPREHARVLRGTVRRVGLTPEQLLSEGFRVVPADAVVIPRSAIPDGLVERLETRRGAHRSTQDKIDQIAAARLLSGGATEGRTCWPEEGT